MKFSLTFLLIVCFCACRYDMPKPYYGGYPDEVGKIFTTKCATVGCHDSQSKIGAGGFDFTTWTTLFEGGNNGSSVIPYRADQSFLMYFINTYPDLGLQLLPTMPNGQTPLSKTDVVAIRDWISNGAPDKNGYVWLSDNPSRRKFYVCNQGCDLVTVFDEQSRLPMRVIDVGTSPLIEAPHDIVVSPDGNYWYVAFLAGQVFQKFRCGDDGFAAQANVGPGSWTSMTISSDGRYAFVVNWSYSGSVAIVDLSAMNTINIYTPFIYPHGSAVSADTKTLYITAQSGNCIYKTDITNILSPIQTLVSLQTGVPASESANTLQPHQVAITPDGSKYFVTCQGTNEVRVMNVANDSLLAIIPTGGFPQELEFSAKYPYLFVSCMNDTTTFPGNIGSIAVINYQANTLVKSVFSGWQPHGLDVDDEAGLVYIANRNISSSGPAPHHTSTCGGRNGYVTIIDMKTLILLPGYKIEVSVDPYEVSVRK